MMLQPTKMFQGSDIAKPISRKLAELKVLTRHVLELGFQKRN
jgi:hypothetical protein